MSLISDILPDQVDRFESVEDITPEVVTRILSGDRSDISIIEAIRLADGSMSPREAKLLVIRLIKELARRELVRRR